MSVKITIALLLFLKIASIEGAAQSNDIKFTSIGGVNGKPIGKIRNITQDPQGYMWFSGESERCIYRYDGNRIIAFRHESTNPNSLGGISINSIFADNSGMIWIGMGEGLDQYNPATGIFKHYRYLATDTGSLSPGNVNPVLKDRMGRLWVGTDHGLDCLDEKTGKFIHYRNEPGNPKSLSDNVVWNIYEDRQGVIWIATGFPFFKTDPDAGGLNRLNADGTFTRYKHDPKDPQSLINNKVRAMFEDSRGVFWVGTSGDGLHTMDRKTGRFERHLYDPAKPDQLSRPPRKNTEFYLTNDQVSFIIEDGSGFIWIGTMGSGINRYDTLTKKITHYEGSHGFPDSSAWNAFVSRDGTVWLSTEENHLYRAGPFVKPVNSILQGAQVSGFLEDQDGFLWIGTHSKGLLQYDQQMRMIHDYQNDGGSQFSLSNGAVACLFQNQADSIWLGTTDGVVIFHTITKKFSRFPLGFDVKDALGGVFDILQDKQGLMWFSTGGGIGSCNYKDGSIKRYQPDSKDSGSISSNRITSFLEDRAGGFWVGSVQGGFSLLNKKTDRFRHYLRGLNGICMFEDKEGTLWAATNRGLYRYHKEEDQFLPFFDLQSDFSIEYIFGIAEDDSKNLWVVTPNAIIKINPGRNGMSVYGRKFGVAYTSPHAIYKTRKGMLLIGHSDGFYAFHPEDLETGKTASKIIITDLFINSHLVLPGEKSPLKTPVEDLSDLVLDYNQNTLGFNFTAMDYGEPGRAKYFTLLENYDDTWREALGEKNSNYFNIPPGKYVYRVKAFNSDGEKLEKRITIRINPPWWNTWWFRSLAILFAVLLFYAYVQYRSRALKRRNLLLEKNVLQRTNELNNSLAELKTAQDQLIQSEKMASLGELTSGIAHEIKNPLNFINNFSEINMELITEIEEEQNSILSENNKADITPIIKSLKKNSEKINHHGKRIDEIVKGMLQHSRLGNVNKEPVNINALCDESLKLAYHGFRAKEKTFNASFETRFDPDIPQIKVVPQDIGRVLLNLINNAFYTVNEKKKHNQADSPDILETESLYKPSIIVSTKKSADKIFITISDNGMGIPPQIINKIFQPFFTTKPTGDGTGLGLSMSYDIISKSHGGEILVKSKEGLGTDFEIVLPVK
ncbi:MAG: two-component regulator propeller domain-containing protein [Chitinophagaceae bacterium]